MRTLSAPVSGSSGAGGGSASAARASWCSRAAAGGPIASAYAPASQNGGWAGHGMPVR
jgi:hypothetical protein